MTASTNPPPDDRFGGPWTTEKLEILGKYLDAYTTALKNQPFKLMYIDAFAGTGDISVQQEHNGPPVIIDGSARRAIKIIDKPFDRLILIEKDYERYRKLVHLKTENPIRDIQIENCDANPFLRNMSEDWKIWRGVLLLDPFATEVEWATIRKIAEFNALDTWILFPISAITRILPTSKKPDDVSRKWANKLNRIFGDESWMKLYRPSSQQSLFGDELYQRDTGTDGIIKLYKNKLKGLFGRRFMEQSQSLLNSTDVHLYEFIFCVGNENGVKLAKKIARDILKDR